MNTILSISRTNNGDCIILTDIKDTNINKSYLEIDSCQVSLVFNNKSVAKGTFTEKEIKYITSAKKIVAVTDMIDPNYCSFFTSIS